jgi:hypothetical protein
MEACNVCKHIEIGEDLNKLVDFVAQTRAMCKELPPEAISTFQSDPSLMTQSISRFHRTRSIISEIARDKGEEVFNFVHILKEIKEVFLILLDQFPKLYSVLCQMKTPIMIETK